MNAKSAPLALPLVDVCALAGDDPARRAAAVADIAAAARRHGFFYVKNHGVDPGLRQEVFAQSQAFFSLPLADKRAADKALSSCNRGYEPLGGQRFEPDSPPDLKEGFYVGEDLPAHDARVIAGRFNQGPNQWPAGMPAFRAVMTRYHAAMMALSATLMGGVAQAMQLPQDELRAYVSGAMGTLRLLHYPPQPADAAPGEKGCGAHTDFGGLTLLMQDDSGGLQVRDEDSGQWIDAPPLPGTYVINLGDLISRWTLGQFRSNLHRVINVSGHDRYSVPFFFSGSPDYSVRCLDWCVEELNVVPPPPVTVEAHLAECYRRTYA